MYPLADIPGTDQRRPPIAVAVQVSLEQTYDLPKIPLSFRLNYINRSRDTIAIYNPIETLELVFLTAQLKPIEMPRGVPNVVRNSVFPMNENSSPIGFRMAIENGNEVTGQSSVYRMLPGSSLDIIFECEKIVGERIVAAASGSSEKYVYVRLITSVSSQRQPASSRIVESERIRLSVSKASTLPPD